MSLLEAHPDELNGRTGYLVFADIQHMLAYNNAYPVDEADTPRLLRIMVGIFQQRVQITDNLLSCAHGLCQRYSLTEDQSHALLEALNGYAEWYTALPQSAKTKENRLQAAFEPLREQILAKFPRLTPHSTEDRLTVSHFFMGSAAMKKRFSGERGVSTFTYNTRSVTICEDKVWMAASCNGEYFISLDLATQEVTAIPYPPEGSPVWSQWAQSLSYYSDISEEWIVIGSRPDVLACHRPSKTWKRLNLPPSRYCPRLLGGYLYLLFDAERGDKLTPNGDEELKLVKGSGVLRMKLPDGPLETLANSRRTPAETSLDGKPMGVPREIWMTDKGLTLCMDADVFPDFRTVYLDEEKKDWVTYKSENRRTVIKRTDGGCLVIKGVGGKAFYQIALMGPKGVEMLVANPADTESTWPMKPRWNIPKGLCKEFNQGSGVVSPVMRGEDLCVYRQESRGPSADAAASLYYFAAGQTEGMRIPLDFDTNALATRGVHDFALPPRSTAFSHPEVDSHSVQATSYGLVIASCVFDGFWIIPWVDVDAYRKGHSAETAGGQVPTR
jgi:hypothetical protein